MKPVLRVLLCGLVAGGVFTLPSAVVFALMGDDLWSMLPGDGPTSGLFFFAANLASGVWAVWLYSALRPRYGRGMRTALIAGSAWWFIASLQSAKWMALRDVPADSIPALLVASLVPVLVAIVAGAWAYERSAPVGAPG